MERQALSDVVLKLPDEFAIPIEFLKPTARRGPLETRLASESSSVRVAEQSLQALTQRCREA
jgi:hypothetical protein